MLRCWQERYGAELVTLTGDQIELLVARPPRDPAPIAQVAVEMLGYCPDLDVLGTGMVAVLASEVVPHRRWSFGGTDPATRNRRAWLARRCDRLPRARRVHGPLPA